MRKLAFIFILCSVIVNAQNWDVFNKDYRYNYKYDNSAVVSNVLFAEAVTVSASHTVISTNTIGVVTGTLLTIDQPQFLMKTIVKQANGTVFMYNPSTITIIPTCSVSQTWTFDSGNNFTATCVAISTLTIFNVVDSIKTILVNNVDSVVLSKQFGIIQFPKLYAQNKYYRLVGIENKATYDLNSLFGEKVPNAWDFYDYYIGFKWCVLTESTPTGGPNVYCTYADRTVKTKTATANSYIYTVDGIYRNSPGPIFSSYCTSATAPSTVINNSTLVVDGSPFAGPLGLSSPSLTENSYYPGYVVSNGYSPAAYVVVKFGKDNTGRFYKYVGRPCSVSNNLGVTMPNQNEPAMYDGNGAESMYLSCHTNHTWGVGLGKVNEMGGYCLSGYQTYCTTCFGTVGLPDLEKKTSSGLVYPNPSNTQLNFSIDKGTVRVFDNLGNLVKQKEVEVNDVLDISNLSNGLYMVEIQTDSFKSSQKLIIQH